MRCEKRFYDREKSAHGNVFNTFVLKRFQELPAF
jgi:hypothetical protein